MKLTYLIKSTMLVTGLSAACLSFAGDKTTAPVQQSSVATKYTEDQTSYAQGYATGLDFLKTYGMTEVQIKAFIDGIKAAYGLQIEKDYGLANNDQLAAAASQFAKDITARYQEREKESHQGNIEAGEKYLQDYLKNNKGAVLDKDGFAYVIKKAGKGSAISITDDVKLVYVGKLIDGTIFDQSTDKARPVQFNLSKVIQGFGKAVTKLKDGGKIEVVIPYNLAYGSGSPGDIKPYSTLVFEIEVLSHTSPSKK